jgi:hypothetical protein
MKVSQNNFRPSIAVFREGFLGSGYALETPLFNDGVL